MDEDDVGDEDDKSVTSTATTISTGSVSLLLFWTQSLLPYESPIGDLGPHGNLFLFLIPQRVHIFIQGPLFTISGLKTKVKTLSSHYLMLTTYHYF